VLVAGLALAAVSAFVMTLVVTQDALGQYPDSAVYVGTAQNLLDGRGLTTPFDLQFNPYAPADAVALVGRFPLTTFPPLYPALLAVGGAFGFGRTDAARFLDALMLAVTVVLIGLVALRITRSTTIAVVSAFASALSINMLINHTLLMADPLLLVTALAAFLLLPRLLRAPTPGAIVAVGACCALASLARFAGVALGVTAVLATLAWAEQPIRRRVRSALLVGAVALTPLLVWIVATRIASPRTGQLRPLGWHFPRETQIDTFLRVSASWLVGADLTESVATSIVVLVILVVVVGALSIVLATRGARRPAPVTTSVTMDDSPVDLPGDTPDPGRAATTGDDDWRDSDRLLGAIGIFVVVSVLVLLATATFFDASIPVEGRLLLPIQLGGILLVPGLLFRVTRQWSTRTVAVVVTVAFLMLCAWPWRSIARGYGTVTTAQLLDDGWAAGNGSPLGRAVAKLPAGALVASNYPATVYQSGGHASIFVPPRRDIIAGRDNEHLPRQLDELGRILARRRGYVALYNDATTFFASHEQLARAMNLVAVGTFPDGTLYRVDSTPTP
jgi:4-amino-4-deoxy-L-arabinose transferase-like glycosyltransferase